MEVFGIEGRALRKYRKDIKYTYSTAALAIRLLKSILIQTWAQLRDVVLYEDFEAIAMPACHARGLIPFCRENSQLRVEWVVNFWRSALTIDSNRVCRYHSNELIRDLHGPLDEEVRDDQLISRSLTKAVDAWILEVQLLPSLGMPQSSFTLMLDGDAIPEKSAMVFDIIQRDAAWQTALDIR